VKASRTLLDRLIAWSPVLLLGGFAALTYWLNAQILAPPAPFDGSGRHDPDVYIENFKASVLGPDGQVRQAIVAKAARHFPDDDTTDFDAPLITFSEQGKSPVSVSADHATISGDQKNAYFKGNVKGVRDATQDGKDGPTIMTSEYLHVQPKDDKVDTDKAVTISDPRGIISGVGMEFDNKSKTFLFKSRVNGQLQPSAK
jgi:lipopolysaccharide export system protein LptC